MSEINDYLKRLENHKYEVIIVGSRRGLLEILRADSESGISEMKEDAKRYIMMFEQESPGETFSISVHDRSDTNYINTRVAADPRFMKGALENRGSLHIRRCRWHI